MICNGLQLSVMLLEAHNHRKMAYCIVHCRAGCQIQAVVHKSYVIIIGKFRTREIVNAMSFC